MNSYIYNHETLSERDRAFLTERQQYINQGYRPLKRIYLDDNQVDTCQAKWILKDREHLAKWRLNRRLKDERDRERTETRIRQRNQEYYSYLINCEYEKLNREFWANAPKMLPSQRFYWEKGRWGEYYWSNTLLKKEIQELDNTEKLWFELPEIPKYCIIKN